METIGKLTNIQLEILKLFNYNLAEDQLLEIKKLLANYFANEITNEMDDLWNRKEWDESKIEQLRSEHLRTKYE